MSFYDQYLNTLRAHQAGIPMGLGGMGAGMGASSPPGLLGGFEDPRTQGLLGAGLSLLQSSGPSTTPTSLGQNIGRAGQVGLGAYQGAQDKQAQNAFLQAKTRSLQPDQWVQEQGPRGSLLQRNQLTGETKQVVGTTDPGILQLMAAQLAGSRETDPNAPWRNIADPKKRDDARMRFGQAADQRLAKEQESVDVSQGIVSRLDRFVALNESTSTGAQYKIPGAKSIASGLSTDVAEMQAIVDFMTPIMRQGLPGAASDRDVAMFRGATVGLDKPKEANVAIAQGLKEAHQNKIDRADFLARYIAQFGHDRGADAMWRRYLNKNPIFDHQASRGGKYVLNEKRQSYQDFLANLPWVRGQNPTEQTPAEQTPAEPPPSQSQTQDNSWVNRAMSANPGMSREQIIQEGIKRGKIPRGTK